MPDLDTITEIDETFRQHLFAEWLNKDNKQFNVLKSKFNELSEKQETKGFVYLDPSKTEEVKNAVGDLLTEVQFNNTHLMNVIIPKALRNALFQGWNERGNQVVRLLYPFGELCR